MIFRRNSKQSKKIIRFRKGDGAITIEELERAPKLPTFFDGEVCKVVSDEVLGWVIFNAETWKPRRNPSAYKGRSFEGPVELGSKVYDGAIFMDDGRILVADSAIMRILADADGTKTVNDIAARMVAEWAEVDEGVREALEKNDREKLMSLYSALYCAFAVLKERGLLI